MSEAVIFRALADPSRRDLLSLIREGAKTVGYLVEHSGMSQPLVSRHLRILLDAHLVSVQSQGRSRLYSLRANGFLTMHQWLAHYESFWTDKLDRLDEVLQSS